MRVSSVALILALLTSGLAACTIEMQERSSTSPFGTSSPPSENPASARPAGARVTVALLPTSVSGVGEAKAGAWFEAFRQAVGQDPRVDLVDSKDAVKTLEHHRKGKFNAFKDVTADIWVESSVSAPKEAGFNKLTGKVQEAPQLQFRAVLMRGPDDRRSANTFSEAGRFFMNEAHAAQHREVDLDLVKKIVDQLLKAL